MSTPRVLFILKQRQAGPYGSWSHSPEGKTLPSGLSVSATQMAYALDDLRIENKLVQVVDNNCIDREVSLYKPTHVIIEAFWVVPEKFDVLKRLHPNVKWIIRNHSKSDFLSHEGGMVGWAIDYVKKGLFLACNSPEAASDFRELAVATGANPEYVIYLPNYYRAKPPTKGGFMTGLWKFLRWIGIRGRMPKLHEEGELHVGCFGAIRPLKNHLHQAIAAIIAADILGLKLKFFINGNRVEGKAEPILKSMQQLFMRHPYHELVELGWMPHEEFTKVVHKMDIVTQVSNSETFNIVAADAVANGVPVLVSDEIPWLDNEYFADPNCVHDIARKMVRIIEASGNGYLQADQLMLLREYTDLSKCRWSKFLNGHCC